MWFKQLRVFFRNCDAESLGNVIKSLVDYHHWTPQVISEMYCDDYDFQGLFYWYDELIRINKLNKK